MSFAVLLGIASSSRQKEGSPVSILRYDRNKILLFGSYIALHMTLPLGSALFQDIIILAQLSDCGTESLIVHKTLSNEFFCSF